MSLENYLLIAMHACAPVAQHAYVEDPVITETRYLAIATDVASVALDPDEAPLFDGEDGRLRTAVLILSVASSESGGFRGDVAFCRRAGDGGRAWGLYQSHRSTERVCSSVREATRVALSDLRGSMAMCKHEAEDVRLAAYASGSCTRGWFAARQRWTRARDWVRTHAPS